MKHTAFFPAVFTLLFASAAWAVMVEPQGRQGCLIINQSPAPGEVVTWSGGCKGGYADGTGKAEWVLDGTLLQTYEGTVEKGRISGKGVFISQMDGGIRYEGGFLNEMKHGPGRQTLMNGEVLIATFEKNQPVGKVRVESPDGAFYEGDYQLGRPHGQGHLTNSEGATYDGEFQRGRPHGKGVLKSDEVSFTGTFVNGRPEGQQITMVRSDGIRYEGSFKAGLMSGPGKLTFPDGNYMQGEFAQGVLNGVGESNTGDVIYRGQFANGKKEGRGRQEWQDSRYYDGEFRNDKREGQGVMRDPEGNLFAGAWVNDLLNGEATATTGDGFVYYRGHFADGMFDGHGERFWKDDNLIKEYKGQFQKNHMHGAGTAVDFNGVTYKGMWEHSRLNGPATVTGPKGDVVECHFVAGHLEGRAEVRLASGIRVLAHFTNSKLDGWQTFFLPGGEKIEGEWSQGRPVGVMSLTNKDGKRMDVGPEDMQMLRDFLTSYETRGI